MKSFSLSFVVVSLVAVPAAAAEDKPTQTVSQLSWMGGSWIERKGAIETEEHWLAPKGGVMLGISRTARGEGKPTSFEFLRIAQTSAGVSYFAMPQGRPATEFPAVELTEKKVVFENPKHDFPQRISYWLDVDGTLRARIDGEIRGQKRSQEWHWEKAR